MKRFVTLAILAVGLSAMTADAQGLKMPQPSSSQTISQDFGLGKITISYSRPNVKGRQIFGDLVPFDKVWRTGANSATLITFTDEVKVQGQTLPAGEYGLFTIPGKNEWTIIFNKSAKQWGSYSYNQAEDVLRVKVKPETLKEKAETFSIQFAQVYPTAAQLELKWANTLVSVGITTDIDSRVMANIETAMQGEKKPYFQAANYYFENGKDLKKALEWASAAEAAEPKAPWIKLLKGKIQLKAGDKQGAAATATAGLQLAKEINNEEYVRLHSALLADAKK
ncbi:DUF2911 domain-containing protein [Pedobacter sp. SYSU D00535]|uniref:DUF2911 domain-containing protein n=1 Tax=Pedobacter sp. SYSU D00535 TaxID=2810308 RepID=UPI001A97C244|nr:DUF2911 domain-containing protein [Pedobacter sp. SYSU D00535]